MSIKWVHERKSVLFTWMYRSVLADHVYLQLDTQHLSAVATALPWIFNQCCWKCFMFEGSFIWIYQKQMPVVMYMSEGLGWNRAHLHQVQFEGNKKFPFWDFLVDLNSMFFWRNILERVKFLDWVCHSSSSLKPANHLTLQQKTCLWKNLHLPLPPKYLVFTKFLRLLFFKLENL